MSNSYAVICAVSMRGVLSTHTRPSLPRGIRARWKLPCEMSGVSCCTTPSRRNSGVSAVYSAVRCSSSMACVPIHTFASSPGETRRTCTTPLQLMYVVDLSTSTSTCSVESCMTCGPSSSSSGRLELPSVMLR